MNNITVSTSELPRVIHNLVTIKSDLEELRARYETAIYDDNTITIAKKERAMLNNVVKDLDDKRKAVKQAYLVPYNEFEKEIKVLENILLPAIDNIDKQVKSYEEEQKKAKQEQIQAYFDGVIGELKEFVPLSKITDSWWLNKGSTQEQIERDIDDHIDKINNDLMSIADLKSENESQLKAIYFRTLDLSCAISENARLKRETAKVETMSDNIKPQPKLEVIEISNGGVEKKTEYAISFMCTKRQFSEVHSLLYSLGIKWKDLNGLDF